MIHPLRLLFFVLAAWFSVPSASAGSAYFWHRARQAEDLLPFADWQIYALTGEYRKDRSPVLLKYLPDSVPVIRMDTQSWQLSGFAEKFAADFAFLPPGEIQIDCDVPEAKLLPFAGFLKELRRKMPDHFFSVTLLPCHLSHPELASVLEQVRYSVLQLHALSKPEDLPGEYQLFPPALAELAVKRMRTFRRPFKIALPSYGYTLHYKTDGRFRRISAENEPPFRADEIRKTALPDWREVIAFRQANPDLEVIWFRLPRQGDHLALEAENLKRLDRNELPVTKLEVIYRENGITTQIYWRNHGLPGVQQTYTQNLGGGSGEAFFYNGATPVRPVPPGQVPEQITGPIPPPGAQILIGEIIKWKKEN